MSLTDVLGRSERRTDRDEEGLRILLAVAHSTGPSLGLVELVEWTCVVAPAARRADPAVLAGIAREMNLGLDGTVVPTCP